MIAFRCQRAGVLNPFDSLGMEKVHELTNGVPRAIVTICAHAYKQARRAGYDLVPLDFILRAAETTIAADRTEPAQKGGPAAAADRNVPRRRGG